MMPEGFGKSSLVRTLVQRGMKVVFCAKSNSQLIEKEATFYEWGLKTDRYVSREQNIRNQLGLIGIPASSFKLVSYPSENPYAPQILDESSTLNALAEVFDEYGIESDIVDPIEFFEEHYTNFEAPPLDGRGADVLLLTFAAFQAKATGKRQQWWESLNLIAERRKVVVDESNFEWISKYKPKICLDETYEYNIPIQKVIVIIDDPDRSDVDWLRPISDDAAEKLLNAFTPITKRQLAQESPVYYLRRFPDNVQNATFFAATAAKRNERRRLTPIHKIVTYKAKSYIERRDSAVLGYKFATRSFKPKLIVTTTEWITGNFALQSLRRSGLVAVDFMNMFHTDECLVTAISTTIVRSANHALLLPIIERLKAEFPDDGVTLIADGLACEYNLSNNKGRNDLAEKTTIIKLSWPNPSIVATIGAHFCDIDKLDHDAMLATLLADVCNQAIGRNQGFRFKGKQAIVLIDPRWAPTIMAHALIRYKLTPWTKLLPNYNKKTSKKAAVASIIASHDQPALERRLLELIYQGQSFGLSEEAKKLCDGLPAKQRTIYRKWLDVNGNPDVLDASAEKAAKRKAQMAEAVRRHRAKKKHECD